MADQPDPHDGDVERYEQQPAMVAAVSAAPEPRTLFATVTAAAEQERPPVIPAWLRNAQQRRDAARAGLRTAGYVVAKQTTLLPVYAAKMTWYAPKGLVIAAWRVGRWTFDGGSFGIRQHAATKNNYEDYHKLTHQRDKRVSRRLWVTGPAAALLAVGVVLLVTVAPWWWRCLAVLLAAPPLAHIGRPVGKPIIEWVTVGPEFTQLTAEQVRAALVVLGVAKDPAALKFPPPGVHRDGPGWLARVNLPPGAKAVKLLEDREGLSSALRLPVDQIWPEIGPDHAGQLDLWVGQKPASKMPAPRWELCSRVAATSYFDEIAFGHDPRLRPRRTVMFQRNYLIGGQPGSGKTFAARALALGALLDPTVELQIAAFKPAEDFFDLKPWCSRYICGVDDQAFAEAEAMVEGGLADMQRRQKALGKLKREGKIAEGCTDPVLARAGLGLHPKVLVFDEVHELFLASKAAGQAMVRLMKGGRSCGITVVLVTQLASKDSVPSEITRVVSSRWCLSVQDQVANDQIMGTGAYKRGRTGTVFRPRVDAGWGATDGMADDPGSVRAYYPPVDDLDLILRRIKEIREGVAFDVPDTAPARDVLDDVLHVFAYIGERGIHRDTLLTELVERWPDFYGRHNAESLSALLAARGAPAGQVKVGGVNRNGWRREAVERAARGREITGGNG